MDKKSATLFKGHMNSAVRELSLALFLTKEAAAEEEFTAIRKSIGHIMAAMHTLLHESVYSEHPELNDLLNDQNDADSHCGCSEG